VLAQPSRLRNALLSTLPQTSSPGTPMVLRRNCTDLSQNFSNDRQCPACITWQLSASFSPDASCHNSKTVRVDQPYSKIHSFLHHAGREIHSGSSDWSPSYLICRRNKIPSKKWGKIKILLVLGGKLSRSAVTCSITKIRISSIRKKSHCDLSSA